MSSHHWMDLLAEQQTSRPLRRGSIDLAALRTQPTTPRGVLYAIGIGIGLAGVVSIVQAVLG